MLLLLPETIAYLFPHATAQEVLPRAFHLFEPIHTYLIVRTLPLPPTQAVRQLQNQKPSLIFFPTGFCSSVCVEAFRRQKLQQFAALISSLLPGIIIAQNSLLLNLRHHQLPVIADFQPSSMQISSCFSLGNCSILLQFHFFVYFSPRKSLPTMF